MLPPDPPRTASRSWNRRAAWCLPAALLSLVLLQPPPAYALRTGGTGNDPLNDPGWPAGAAAVFNTRARVAWWEGSFGGEWHAECRGDAESFNEVLKAFAAIKAPNKRLVVRDGTGQSYWLNAIRDRAKAADARIDWEFVVWVPAHRERLQGLPGGIRPRGNAADEKPAPQIDAYVGGNLRWADVTIPAGIEVVDERLEAHGFTLADGTVLEGKVTDLKTGQPLAASMRLERVEPQPTGGYRYTSVATANADARGRWVLKSAPAGWHRIVIEAEGYVPRIAGHGQFDGQPRWSAYNTGLAKPASVSGRVVDAEGRPLADVQVRLQAVVTESGGLYDTPAGYTSTTGADGRFRTEQIPAGKARVDVHKPGYCGPGLGLPIEIPASDVELRMLKAATLLVAVDFDGVDLEAGYIVKVAHEAGAAVGRWGGSGNIDAKGSIKFENVPPGRYVVTGRPNPGNDSQQTDPHTVELLGGESVEVILKAK